LDLQATNADVVIAQLELMKWMNSNIAVLPINSATEKLQSPVASTDF